MEGKAFASSVLFAVLGSALLIPSAAAQVKVEFAPATARIVGLGESHPGVEDVSEVSNFHVYAFDKDGIRYLQVNTASGQVIAAFGVAQGKAFELPMVGTAAVATQVARAGVAGAVQATNAQCPCSSQVVYSGPDGKIVVVYGSGGDVIQVVYIPPVPAPTTEEK